MKSIEDKLKEDKTNKIEETLKLRNEISALVSKLDEQRQNNAHLSAKLDEFKGSNIKLDKNDIQAILSLKTALNEVSIPSEVRLIKESKTSFSDVTRTFLIWFFSISFVVMVGCVWFVQSAYNDVYKPTQVEKEQVEWLYQYAEEMAKKNPKTHETYLRENPFPR